MLFTTVVSLQLQYQTCIAGLILINITLLLNGKHPIWCGCAAKMHCWLSFPLGKQGISLHGNLWNHSCNIDLFSSDIPMVCSFRSLIFLLQYGYYFQLCLLTFCIQTANCASDKQILADCRHIYLFFIPWIFLKLFFSTSVSVDDIHPNPKTQQSGHQTHYTFCFFTFDWRTAVRCRFKTSIWIRPSDLPDFFTWTHTIATLNTSTTNPKPLGPV